VKSRKREPATVSDRVRALHLSDARWQAILRSAPDAIVAIDGNGHITLFNPTAERMFGYAAEETLGRDVALLMPAPYAEEHHDYVRRYERTGEARAIGHVRRIAARRKSGEVFPIELSVSEARAGEEVTYVAIIRDVTENERAQERLGEHARLQAAVASLGQSALAAKDLAGLMQAASEVVANTLSVEYVEVLELLPGGDILVLRAGVGWRPEAVGREIVSAGPGSPAGTALLSGKPVIVEDLGAETRFRESKLLREHGVVSGLSVVIEGGDEAFGVLGAHTASRCRFSDDDANFLRSVANVLAEGIARRRAEAELAEMRQTSRQRERLADIGAITAKVVHDLGNPLAAVSMQAQLILRRVRRGDLKPAELVEPPVERVLTTVRRLESLVREFNSFAREQRLELRQLELSRFLQTIVDLWAPLAAGRSIDLALGGVERGLGLRADEEKLRRVLDNLIGNAVEAIDQGPGEVRVRVAIPSREKVRISVEDTGPGIPEGVDVFRLFETTKPQGTGIGLAVARQIIVAHGGIIEHETRESSGAVFHVELPRAGPARR
jgi:PAS domain S-box-containing protein